MKYSPDPQMNLKIAIAVDDETRRLIELAKTDREAIAQLYRLHYRLVVAYVHRRVPNAADADDVVSEVFVAMVKGLPRFRWQGIPFRIWLYRIATYKIGRWARSRRRVALVEFSELQDKSSRVDDCIDTELIAIVLASLPTKFQDVLALHYFEGLSIEDIASIVKSSQGTVKSRLYTGRNLMRQQLEMKGIKIE